MRTGQDQDKRSLGASVSKEFKVVGSKKVTRFVFHSLRSFDVPVVNQVGQLLW